MIAAVGRFEPAVLRRALIRMAANDNPAHEHERRPLRESFRHTDGWGAAWVEDGRLRTLRRAVPVLQDGQADQLDTLRTALLLLHARRATVPNSLRLENTHPFRATRLGRDWAFCHNGSVEDVDCLRPAPGLVPQGGTDSERLFHHFLSELTESGSPRSALAATIAVPRSFTALHCLAASSGLLLAAACRHPEKSLPEYHALWLGEGPGVRVVSSEPVDGMECDWARLPDPGVITLEVE